MSDTPRVWIGCLASYNAGRLIGEWVDATDTDVMNEAQKRVAAQAVKAAKEAKEYPVYFGEPEEFFIADYDNFPSAVVSHLGEYPSYDTVAKIATLIEDKGEEASAFFEFASNVGMDLSGLDEDDFYTHFRGEWDSKEAFVQEQADELGVGGLPGRVWTSHHASFEDGVSTVDTIGHSYIDWDVVVREMFDHGNYSYVTTGSGSGYVFESEV